MRGREGEIQERGARRRRKHKSSAKQKPTGERGPRIRCAEPRSPGPNCRTGRGHNVWIEQAVWQRNIIINVHLACARKYALVCKSRLGE